MEPYTNLHHNAKSFFDIVKKSAVGNLVFMKLKLCFLTSYQFAPLQLCFLRYKPKPARPCFQVVNIAVQKCDLWKSEFYKLSALGLFLFVRVTKNDNTFETCQIKAQYFGFLYPIFPNILTKISQYFGRHFPIFFDILAVVVLYFGRATKLKYGKT